MYLPRPPNSPSDVLLAKVLSAKALWIGGGAMKPEGFQVVSRAINKYFVSTDSGQFAVRNTNIKPVSSSSRKWKLAIREQA